jgi:hypothetical protein
MYFSISTRSSPKLAAASRRQEASASAKSAAVSTRRIPCRPARDGLDQDGIADGIRLGLKPRLGLVFAKIAGGYWHAGGDHARLGRVLEAHRGDRGRLGTNPYEARIQHRLREFGVFGKEAVAGVDRLRSGGPGGGDDLFPTR